jgi:hypothetical protein
MLGRRVYGENGNSDIIGVFYEAQYGLKLNF